MQNLQDPSRPGVELLETAHRAALGFLFRACFSIGCYRNAVHGMSKAMRRTGKVQEWQLRSTWDAIRRSAEATHRLDQVFETVLPLVIEANRLEHGDLLAFEEIHAMSRSVSANWSRITDETPLVDAMSILIDTGRYLMCSDDASQVLWTRTNREFVITYIKHGIRSFSVPHPEAETRAVVGAMLSPLLKNPSESWTERPRPDATASDAAAALTIPPVQASDTSGGESSAIADSSVEEAAPSTRVRLLVGWRDILEALGIDHNRAGIARVKRLNENRAGPITWPTRRPQVELGLLLAWIEGLNTRADEPVVSDETQPDVELDNKHEMRRLGFQPKARPNNPGSLSRKFDRLE